MDELRKQVGELREGFEALNELLEKERKINETYEHNVKRTLNLHEYSRKYAVEKGQGNINMELALQLAFEKGAKWADETMIEKACEWLDSVDTDDYMDSGIFQMYDLIIDFKKAMGGDETSTL